MKHEGHAFFTLSSQRFMNKQTGLTGKMNLPHARRAVSFNLTVIIFEEDGATICYCPALDLAGYGTNEEEARQSYEHVLSEYFDYTTKKKTLVADLRKYGWKVKIGLSKRVQAPEVTTLLQTNKNFKRIFENFPFRKEHRTVDIPVFA